MDNYSYYSYLAAAAAYFLLLPLALIGIKKNPVAISLIVAVVMSLTWAGYTAFLIYNDELVTSEILPLETLRDTAWFFLLSTLISRQQFNNNYSLLFKSRLANGMALLIMFILALEVFSDLRYQIQQFLGQDLRLFAHVVFAIIGLMLVEQLYRNATLDLHWTVKFLCLGLGALFTIDFIVYSKSLLFVKLDYLLWNSRGFINALIVPLLAISILRLQINNAIRITASRKVVFHTTVLLGSGLYLILMSLAGFYIRDYGGNWGGIAQIIFIFLAVLLLLILFVSGKARAIAKVYFNKHFFHYRYDYRDEWIKLSKTIAQLDSINELSGFIIKTLSDLADSSGGGLWLKNEQGDFYLAEESNLGFYPPQLIKADQSLIQFMLKKQWIIDFVEFSNYPKAYNEVDLSQWQAEQNNISLIIPLFRQNDLVAFVALTKAKVHKQLIWEDHDLLKTVGMQLTNALALSHASDALSRSRQFEAYNRLSAYLVHDLKNLVAQISLIVKNAEKHKYNPEFIDDSIETLKNVVYKIEHLLNQLKKGQVKTDNKIIVNLAEVIKDVAIQQAGNKPALQLTSNQDKIEVLGEKEKITAILGHLVQNAQEATAENGIVSLELSKNENQAIIKVIDNGSGMDNKFIAERLFKPFDTTKGNAGMGIGVYEAHDYIVKQSGSCDVESKLGVGTTFTIKLPLAKQED
ncbi:MAG: PEP-CTERM system histidine kinase PrsK [Methylococcaceae bacterium]|nr:PEP-CTERM system histidine kinase PrsK [Methylococcaceae bacterium]OYV23250.1 MAG: Multi-sensor signal transduction histidine kinase [Methylococcaceae bacterium NSO1]